MHTEGESDSGNKSMNSEVRMNWVYFQEMRMHNQVRLINAAQFNFIQFVKSGKLEWNESGNNFIITVNWAIAAIINFNSVNQI